MRQHGVSGWAGVCLWSTWRFISLDGVSAIGKLSSALSQKTLPRSVFTRLCRARSLRFPPAFSNQNKNTRKGCFYFVLVARKRYFLRKPCIVLNPRDFFFVRQRHFISLLLLYHIIDDSFLEFRIINTFLHKQKSPIKVQLPSWVIRINVYSSIYRLIYFFTVFENDLDFFLWFCNYTLNQPTNTFIAVYQRLIFQNVWEFTDIVYLCLSYIGFALRAR